MPSSSSGGTITGGGVSDRWVASKKNVIRIFDESGILQGPWKDQPGDVLCANKDDTYGKIAHYLLHDY